MSLSRIFRHRSRRQLEAEIANLRAECNDLTDRNNMLHEANQGLCDQLKAFIVPLPGEERREVKRCLN
jgi:FtsZ-binding cell division protein ZapB